MWTAYGYLLRATERGEMNVWRSGCLHYYNCCYFALEPPPLPQARLRQAASVPWSRLQSKQLVGRVSTQCCWVNVGLALALALALLGSSRLIAGFSLEVRDCNGATHESVGDHLQAGTALLSREGHEMLVRVRGRPGRGACTRMCTCCARTCLVSKLPVRFWWTMRAQAPALARPVIFLAALIVSSLPYLLATYMPAACARADAKPP